MNKDTKTKAFPPKSIGRQLNFTTGASNAVVGRMLEAYGLSLAQWAVMNSLWRAGPLSIKTLSEWTGNKPPAVSRLVSRMVEGGLLERTTDPDDGRVLWVSLSVRGEEMRALGEIYHEVNAVLMQGLTEHEKEQLFELLKRVEANGKDWLARHDENDA